MIICDWSCECVVWIIWKNCLRMLWKGIKKIMFTIFRSVNKSRQMFWKIFKICMRRCPYWKEISAFLRWLGSMGKIKKLLMRIFKWWRNIWIKIKRLEGFMWGWMRKYWLIYLRICVKKLLAWRLFMKAICRLMIILNKKRPLQFCQGSRILLIQGKLRNKIIIHLLKRMLSKLF